MMTIQHLKLRIQRLPRGQTMAEYALILLTVVVVCILGYQVMGTTITSLVGQVDPLL